MIARAALAIATLSRREVTRFLRQRSRVVGALLQPLLFWLLIGAGLRASFRPGAASTMGGIDYAEYFFPGVLALSVLFSAIFATISVVEDRKSGFLQGVLVSPAPRWGIVAGQAAGSTLLAAGQAGLILSLAPVVGMTLTVLEVLSSLGLLLLLGFALSGLGLVLAWRMESTQGFHAIMNLALMPMWLLSGAFFPRAGVPAWLGWIMTLNPMTYGLAALRRCLYLESGVGAASLEGLPALGTSLAIVVVFGAACFVAATSLARRAAA